MELRDYTLEKLGRKKCKVWGRTTGELSPLTVFWTAGGCEVNVRATELWMEVNTDYSSYEIWVSVLINGAHVSRQMLPKGQSQICLFRGMDADTVKNIRIMKDSQAMSGDEQSLLQILGLRTDGSFEEVQDKPCKFEFIGDSITSGEGLYGAKEENDWIAMFFSSVHNYATLVSESCNAEYHIISQSGWGTMTGWDANPHCAVPLYYEQVCGLVNGERNIALGAQKPYDFTSWQPDAVIVNLGTNDASAFDQPMWRDETTGETFEQRKNPDGTYNAEDALRLQKVIIDFLKKVRKHNPQAQLVWVYGMLGTPIKSLIMEAVENYKVQQGDTAADFLELPDTTEEMVGSRCHPGQKSHENVAAVIIDYLKQKLLMN